LGVERVWFDKWTYKRDRKGHRHFTVDYLVQFTDCVVDPLSAENFTDSYAAPFTLYREDGVLICEDPLAFMVEKDAEPFEDTMVRVTCRYTTENSEQARYENPLDRPTIANWGFTKLQLAYQADRNGNLIVNTAGEVMEGLVRDKYYPQVTVIRNESSFNPGLATSFVDTVNVSSILGSPARTVLCTDISRQAAEAQVQNGTLFYSVVQYSFAHNPNTFDKFFLSRGYKELVNGERQPIKVGTPPLPTNEPMNLKSNGRVALPNDTPGVVTARIHNEADFSAFNFSPFA